VSVIGTWIGKVLAAIGGAPAAGALIISGVVVGGLLGAGAGGAFEPEPPVVTDALPIYPCPKTGPALARAPSGQHMLVTGRSADGAWLRIHFAGPSRTEAWVPASAIRLDQPLDDLPIADCQPEDAVAKVVPPGPTLTTVGSFEPTPSPTPSPTATPIPPTPEPPTPIPPTPAPPTPAPPTPSPTPADRSAPKLGNPAAEPPRFWNEPCPDPDSEKSLVSVTAEDPESGITAVTLVVNRPIAVDLRKAMAFASGITWQVTLDADGDGLPPGTYTMTAEGTNGAGLTNKSGQGTFTVRTCSEP
jgi:hypothetical protein